MAERDRAAVDVDLVAIEAQLLLAREVLRREGLVDLDQVEIVERQLRALERLADRRRRAHAHQRRLDADRRPRHDAAERLRAARLRGILAGDHQRRRAVDDAAGVAGRHDAVLLEHRRQLRQDLHRRLGPHVIVLLDERDALAAS